MELVLATYNTGKVREMKEMFAGLGVDIKSLADISDITEVAETGSTFAENAELKAAGYARQVGKWVIADDSGLEVTALGGRPGVHSARFAGENSDHAHKMSVLINEMFESDSNDRSARFVCSMAVANERGDVEFAAEGECRGTIAEHARGTNGFGFDPIFIPEGFDKTFGELAADVKSRMSHRARAAETILRYLRDFTAV